MVDNILWEKLSDRKTKSSVAEDASIGLLTGCIPTNVGDGIPDASHFLDRKRANAMIVPQVLSYLRSVVGVVMGGNIIVNRNAIEIARTEPLEDNVFKDTLGKGTSAGQAIRNQGIGGGGSNL